MGGRDYRISMEKSGVQRCLYVLRAIVLCPSSRPEDKLSSRSPPLRCHRSWHPFSQCDDRIISHLIMQCSLFIGSLIHVSPSGESAAPHRKPRVKVVIIRMFTSRFIDVLLHEWVGRIRLGCAVIASAPLRGFVARPPDLTFMISHFSRHGFS